MAQKVKIGGKEYSCSKEVANYINWLEIRLRVSEQIAQESLDKLSEIQLTLNEGLYSLGDVIKQIKPL